MTSPVNGTPTPLDIQARRLHQEALQSLSPQVLAQLRAARLQAQRQSAASARPWQRRWLAAGATAFSLALASAIGMYYFNPAPPPTSAMPVAANGTQPINASLSAAAEYRDTALVLDENPDLYLWLASTDVQPLAMD